MYGYIYLTTNLINGKKYIGKHKSSEFDPNYKGSGKILWKAINKYSWENFKTEILKECASLEDLNQAEVEEILSRNAVSSKDYYNLNSGGQGSFEYINNNPDKVRKPFVDNHGTKNPNYGHKGYHLSEETRKRMSEVRVGKKQNPEGVRKRSQLLLGTHLSEETKSKIQESMKGRIWVYRIDEDIVRELINPEALNDFLEKGYQKGYGPRKNSPTKGKIRLVKEGKVKYCIPTELDLYLCQGWQRYKGKAIKTSSTTIESIGNEKSVTE